MNFNLKDLDTVDLKRKMDSGFTVFLNAKKTGEVTMRNRPEQKELWQIFVTIKNPEKEIIRKKEFGYIDTAVEYFEKIFI